MMIIYDGNLTLIITDDCPVDYALCAIKCLDRRPPQFRPQHWDDEHKPFIPRYSKFIGQLGGQIR